MEFIVKTEMTETDRKKIREERSRIQQERQWEERKVNDRTEKRMVGTCICVGILAVAFVLVYLTARVNQTSEKRERTKVEKVEACRSLELPAERILCLTAIE